MPARVIASRFILGASPLLLGGLFVCAPLLRAEAQDSNVIMRETLLARAARYVTAFETAFSNVVAEERYEQSVIAGGPSYVGGRRGEHRVLRSDFLLVRAPDSVEWLPFRDVFEVDGRPVRDHDERLLTLVASTDAGSSGRAAEITEESARYNIGIVRTVNHPLLALHVLRGAQQHRFRFSGMKPDASVGPHAFVVEYREVARPTVITGPAGRDMPMHGRVWVDGASGTILQTEVMIDITGLSATIVTRFEHDPAFQIAIPVEMTEEYLQRNITRVVATATYGRFRSFSVGTSVAPGGR